MSTNMTEVVTERVAAVVDAHPSGDEVSFLVTLGPDPQGQPAAIIFLSIPGPVLNETLGDWIQFPAVDMAGSQGEQICEHLVRESIEGLMGQRTAALSAASTNDGLEALQRAQGANNGGPHPLLGG